MWFIIFAKKICIICKAVVKLCNSPATRLSAGMLISKDNKKQYNFIQNKDCHISGIWVIRAHIFFHCHKNHDNKRLVLFNIAVQCFLFLFFFLTRSVVVSKLFIFTVQWHGVS